MKSQVQIPADTLGDFFPSVLALVDKSYLVYVASGRWQPCGYPVEVVEVRASWPMTPWLSN